MASSSRVAAIWKTLEKIWFPEHLAHDISQLDERRRQRLATLVLSGRSAGWPGIEELECRRTPAGLLTVEQVVEIVPPPGAETSTLNPEEIPAIAGPGQNIPVAITPSPADGSASDPRSMPVYAGPGENTAVAITPDSKSPDPRDIPVFAGPGRNDAVEIEKPVTGLAMNAPTAPEGMVDGDPPEIAPVDLTLTEVEQSSIDAPMAVERGREHFGSRELPEFIEQAASIPAMEFATAQETVAEGQPATEPVDIRGMLHDLAILSSIRADVLEKAIDEAVGEPLETGCHGSTPVMIEQVEEALSREIPNDPKTPIPEATWILPAAAAGLASAGIWLQQERSRRHDETAHGKGPTGAPPHDSRRSPRTSYRENVEVSLDVTGTPTSHGLLLAVTRDVSATGMGILHHQPLGLARVRLHFPLGGEFRTRWGRVCWTRPIAQDHFISGIEFED